MELQRNDIIIGKGGLFPIQITSNPNNPEETGWYPVSGSMDLITNNLISLFEYQIGQRFRQEYFGSRLWECLEEPSIPLLLYLVNQFIRESIQEWEPRIEFQKVEGYMRGSVIVLRITYNLVGSGDTQSIDMDFKDTSNS